LKSSRSSSQNLSQKTLLSALTGVTLHLNPGITLVCFQSFSGI
jgi:hypothetical protein